MTHPNAQLNVLSAIHFHAFVQQADLLKVQPVNHEAANQGGAPETLRNAV